MKKFFFVFLALFSALDAQVSSLDIENIKNEQLDLIRSEMKDLQVTSIDDVMMPDFKEVTIVSGPSKKVYQNFLVMITLQMMSAFLTICLLLQILD